MTDLIILKAAETAARWHSCQRRKGIAGEPYVNHLLEVAGLVAEEKPGDTDLIVAALLHDAIEDQKKTPEEIAHIFGVRVADLIVEVTDDKSLEKEERKRLQVETAPHKSADAKLIKLADKTSNVRSLVLSPPDWELERRAAYVDWACAVVTGLRGSSALLEQRFDEACGLARRSFEVLESCARARGY